MEYMYHGAVITATGQPHAETNALPQPPNLGKLLPESTVLVGVVLPEPRHARIIAAVYAEPSPVAQRLARLAPQTWPPSGLRTRSQSVKFEPTHDCTARPTVDTPAHSQHGSASCSTHPSTGGEPQQE
jgi:hypothetical protein